jgi:hypothetical protein
MYLNDKAGWARYSPANLARQPDIEARIHDRAVDAARDHFQRTADLMLGMSEDDVLRKAPELGAQYGVKITARDGLLTMSVGQSLDTSITMSAALLASLGGGALSADTFAKDSAEVRRKGVEMLSTITEEDLAGLDEQGLQNCVRRFQEQKGLKITLHFDSETLAVLDELMRRRSQSN